MIVWRRTSEGLRSDDGVYELQRHEVDDRADHGERWTYWNLVVAGVPLEQHRSQGDARAHANRIARERIRD